MKLGQRDRRALLLLGVAVILVLVFRLSTSDAPAVAVVSQADTTESLELRLRRIRQSMARVPGKEMVLKQATAELAEREKGLFDAQTANQAQAQVLEIVRRLARNAGIEIRSTELLPVQAFGDAYGEVGVAISTECGVEQLVNMMSDLANQPQLLSTGDLRISIANARQKTVNLRMVVSGIVPKRFVPENKA